MYERFCKNPNMSALCQDCSIQLAIDVFFSNFSSILEKVQKTVMVAVLSMTGVEVL